MVWGDAVADVCCVGDESVVGVGGYQCLAPQSCSVIEGGLEFSFVMPAKAGIHASAQFLAKSSLTSEPLRAGSRPSPGCRGRSLQDPLHDACHSQHLTIPAAAAPLNFASFSQHHGGAGR